MKCLNLHVFLGLLTVPFARYLGSLLYGCYTYHRNIHSLNIQRTKSHLPVTYKEQNLIYW